MQRALLYLLILIKIIIVVSIVVGIYSLIRPNKQTLPKSISVEIIKGQRVKDIAKALENEGVINNKWRFYWLYFAKQKPLQAGIFRFEKGESIVSVFNKITSGDIYEEKITIPEGWRSEQIAQMLAKKDLVAYEAFMTVADGKEGTLFPDTYRIAKKTTAETIVKTLVSNYEERTKDIKPTREQLIIASVVEREAKKDEDRATISNVFYNRLKIGMKLESDVTVEYGLDNDRLEGLTIDNIGQFSFWIALKAGEAKTAKSPFNTYKIAGLPPAPICNPGLKSIEAAVKPAQSDYYFFLADKDGKAHFAKTKSEHDNNIRKYLN